MPAWQKYRNSKSIFGTIKTRRARSRTGRVGLALAVKESCCPERHLTHMTGIANWIKVQVLFMPKGVFAVFHLILQSGDDG